MKRYEAKIPLFLIWRFIVRSNKWTLSLTIVLMAIAFINLVFVASLFNGIIEGSNDQVIDTYVGHVVIDPPPNQQTIAATDQVLQTIRGTVGVVGASAQMAIPGTMQFGSTTLSRPIIAIHPEDEATVTNISTHMIGGQYLGVDDTEGIIIGVQLAGGPDTEQNANSLRGARVGDRVTITLQDGTSKALTVRGIFETKLVNTDMRAFITRRLLTTMKPEMANDATTIIIRIDKKGQEQAIIQQLKTNGVTGTFGTWNDYTGLMRSVSKSFASINILMSFVGVLIAAITIFIVIYIDIINRRRQIGILRAIGIKGWIIRSAYVLQSAIYSVFGVILGSIIFFGALVPYFQAHPFSLPICDAVLVINPYDFTIRAGTIVGVAILSGLIPAIYVTRMRVLSAILGK